MKTFLKSAVLLFCMGLIPAYSMAQKVVFEEDEPNTVMLVSFDKAGDEIIRIMNETQNPRFHEPKLPRFLLMDRKGKFALGIGGYVKLAAEYDFGGISDDIDFYPALISGRKESSVRNQYQMDATTGAIFLKLVGHTDLLGDFVVYTAGNFRGGDGKLFELRNAYISARGFTVGYDYGSFMDVGNVPATIDFAGPNGMSIYHATQIRFEHLFTKGLKAGVGVEMPIVEGQTSEHISITKQRMPNFPVYVQYDWSPQSHFRMAAIIRSMTYDNRTICKAESKVGWGVLTSLTFNLMRRWRIYGQGVCGKGIGYFLNDMSLLDVDLVPNLQKEGNMQVLPMTGWFVGMQYHCSPNVFFTTTYGQSRLYSHDGYPVISSSMYHYGQYLNASLFWNITSDLQIGTEYLRGWRTDFNGCKRHANRINLAVQYSF